MDYHFDRVRLGYESALGFILEEVKKSSGGLSHAGLGFPHLALNLLGFLT
jgi:hypothetical protein